MSKYYINSLLGIYSSELAKELSNELSSFYSHSQIQSIFDALKSISNKHDCTYGFAKFTLNSHCKDVSADNVLEDLFTRSYIGLIDKESHYVRFKHRMSKKDFNEYVFNKDSYLIVHSGLKVHLQNR